MSPTAATTVGRWGAVLVTSWFAGWIPVFAADSHLVYREEAVLAYQRNDYATALTAAQEALRLRPDSPRYLHNVAALSLLTGDRAAAMQHLERVALLGVTVDVERDRDFAPLQGTPEFRDLLSRFAANQAPHGQAEVVAELPGRSGIIEGIAYHSKTGDYYFGDVRRRCIWRLGRDGRFTQFTADGEDLLGVFALKIDEGKNLLWASTAAVPEMDGFLPEMKGHAALVAFDLGRGEVVRMVDAPDDGREHVLNDLTLGPGGAVYVSDSKAAVLWQLVADAEELQKVAESPLFSSLQGLVVDNGRLLVADYANGLLSVELATGNVTALAPPDRHTLLGIDGLVPVPGGVVATQNGTTPQRVLRIALDPDFSQITGVTVLASGLPLLTDLTLITLANDRPTVVAGSGWDAAELARTGATPVTARIFEVELK